MNPNRLQRYEFVIPNWTPPSVNPTLGNHWSLMNSMKKAVAKFVGVYAIKNGVRLVTPQFRPVRKLELLVTGWPELDQKLPDPDNFLKIFLDACKQARVIVDDAQDWCPWERPKIVRGHPATHVTLTDLEVRPPIEAKDEKTTKKLLGNLLRKAARDAAKKAKYQAQPTRRGRR